MASTHPVPIGQLKKPGRPFDLLARVAVLYRNVHEKKRQEGMLEDESGRIKFVMWKGTRSQLLKKDGLYQFQNVKVQKWQGRLEVHLDRQTRVASHRPAAVRAEERLAAVAAGESESRRKERELALKEAELERREEGLELHDRLVREQLAHGGKTTGWNLSAQAGTQHSGRDSQDGSKKTGGRRTDWRLDFASTLRSQLKILAGLLLVLALIVVLFWLFGR